MATQAELIAASAAAAVGATLSESGMTNLAAVIESAGRIEPGKEVMVAVDGEEKAVSAWIAGLVSEVPSYFQQAPRVLTSPEAVGNLTQKGLAYNLARNSSEGRTARAEALLADHGGNPWSAGFLNMSVQGAVQNLDHALAARLQAEA